MAKPDSCSEEVVLVQPNTGGEPVGQLPVGRLPLGAGRRWWRPVPTRWGGAGASN